LLLSKIWRNAFFEMSGIPPEYYEVHPIPWSPKSVTNNNPEKIIQGTPRWKDFMSYP
jgi:hypothetical protein